MEDALPMPRTWVSLIERPLSYQNALPVCLNWGFIAVERHHDQSNSYKRSLLTVSEALSIITKAGSMMQVGRVLEK